MQRYMLRRIINLIPVLVLISIVVFSTVRVLPGDPARLLAAIDETGFVDPEVLAAVEKRYGLDKPVVTQYFEWVWGVIRGDWGRVAYKQSGCIPADTQPPELHGAACRAVVAALTGNRHSDGSNIGA